MYICIDESGNENPKSNDYFIIAGYIAKDIYKIRSAYKKAEKIVKNNKKIQLEVELKAINCQKKDKSIILNSLLQEEGILPFCIYYDVSKINKKILKELKTPNDRFNFLLKNALELLLSKNYAEEEYAYINIHNEVILKLDNRNVKVSYKNHLEEYLRKENEIFKKEKNLKEVTYFDSKNSLEIRAADFFANYFWAELNHPETNHWLKKELNDSIRNIVMLNYPRDFKIKKQKVSITPEKKESNINGWKITKYGNSFTYVKEFQHTNDILKLLKVAKGYEKVKDDGVHYLCKFNNCTLSWYKKKNKIMLQGSNQQSIIAILKDLKLQ